jgi:hypothetical protein
MRSLSNSPTRGKPRSRKTPPSLAEQFAQLWRQVQQEQASLANLHQAIDSFYQEFRQKTQAPTAKFLSMLLARAEQFLAFADKKSLSQRERHLLTVWLQKLVSTYCALPGYDPKKAHALHQALEPMEAALQAAIAKHAPRVALEDHDDVAYVHFCDPWAEYGGQQEHSGPSEEAKASAQNHRQREAENLFNGSSLNKMFRQLTKVLHPDLEQDETAKAHKHTAMAQLLQMREEQNVLGIFALYCEHINQTTPTFTEDDFAALIPLLKNQLRQLQEKKQDAYRDDPEKGWAYQTFFHKSPQRRSILLNQYLRELHQESAQLQEDIDEARTLKSFKRQLSDHYNAMAFAHQEHLIDEMMMEAFMEETAQFDDEDPFEPRRRKR